MASSENIWQYSTVHNSACKVIEEQTLWGQTVCRVWLPNQDAVVRVPRSALRPLSADLQPEIEAGRIAYVAERNLEPDQSDDPVEHPLIENFFTSFNGNHYQARQTIN